ncbi:Dicer-like protein 1 [Thoreauomyces humboldtii]|nr:Dicer-like protein 1 [Thoreauomyces humboldtii]
MMGQSTDLDKRLSLVARSYQLDLFARAKNSNVIAVLETGAGKTLISVMLIKHMAELEAASKVDLKNRPSVFLVPMVPLVLQQEAYIRDNSNLNVKHYYGAMGVDDWSIGQWQQQLEEADVMVMTADIFKLMLQRAYVNMGQICLVIFDEAHHARKNHAYNQIMAIHYAACPVAARPKIFGMTASPTFAKESSRSSIAQLEGSLDSVAFTVPAESLAGCVNRATEEVVFYKGQSHAPPPALYYLVQAVAGPAGDLLEKNLKNALAFCDVLGPWCAERALEHAIIDADEKLKKRAWHRRNNVHLRIGVDEALQSEIADTISRLKNYVETSADWEAGGCFPTLDTVSPKVAALLKTLEGYREQADTFCGIIFVERRSTATVLFQLIKKWAGLDFLRCEMIVGHGTGGHNPLDVNMSILQQHKVVQGFRKGHFNLLLATRVAEEGLDIKTCMLVIRFDSGQHLTLTNYIQSRGRARHIASRFVILSDILNPIEAVAGAALQREEQVMRHELHAREADDDDATFNPAIQSNSDEIYIVPSTQASVNLHSAISSLYHYCAVLPKDAYIDGNPVFQVQPVYSNEGFGGFIATITLPMNAPKQARLVEGKFSDRKIMAKRWAAFEAVKRLHALGELDDHLRPIKITMMTGDDDVIKEAISQAKKAGCGGGKKEKAVEKFAMNIPSILKRAESEADAAWLSIVSLRGTIETGSSKLTEVLEFGILTFGAEQLLADAFEVPFGKEVLEVTIAPQGSAGLTSEQRRLVGRFHSTLFKAMLRSSVPDEGDWALMIVPLKTNQGNAATVDWEVISLASNGALPVLDLPDFLGRDLKDFVLFDRIYYQRLYLIDEVLVDITPSSSLDVGRARFDNVAAFYEGRLKCTEPIIADQAVIKARTLPYITQKVREQAAMETAFLIPQFCTVYPVPARLLRGHALHLPIFIQRLHVRLLASDLKSCSFDGMSVDADYRELAASIEDLQMALTAPAADADVNYERLETFGDSFLKVHQTLHLFVTQPSWHEGHLSAMRNQLERNSALRDRASKIGLEGFILGTALNRKDWIPPLQKPVSGELGQEERYALSNKTVADVVEAVIGACVVAGGPQGGAKAVKKMLGGSYEINWADYARLYEGKRTVKRATQLAKTLAVVERNMGYTFKDPSLAVEALTHASALQLAGEGDCYQRLEFLGDAALGFVVTRHLFLLRPSLNPSQLSRLRSELVGNQFLACVAWRLRLPQLMQHLDAGLAGAIANYGALLDNKDAHQELNGDQDPMGLSNQHAQKAGLETTPEAAAASGLFWNRLETAPKAAGDTYEAMTGAVFLDSGFDIEKVWEIVEATLIRPWWNHFVPLVESFAKEGVEGDGKTKTGTIATTVESWAAARGCQEVDISYVQDKATLAFTCTITFHGKVVGTAVATNKKGGKRLATIKALIEMEKHTCDCSVPTGSKVALDKQRHHEEDRGAGLLSTAPATAPEATVE